MERELQKKCSLKSRPIKGQLRRVGPVTVFYRKKTPQKALKEETSIIRRVFKGFSRSMIFKALLLTGILSKIPYLRKYSVFKKKTSLKKKNLSKISLERKPLVGIL